MKTAGIVAEYNPFHNGHAYHIEKTREAGCTHVAVVMGGNYTQRGEPSCAPKDIRCLAALRGGADLVVELPLPWAVSSAERFAGAGVSLLNAMGCVDVLSFGSESGDLEGLRQCAESVDSLDQAVLRRRLKEGLSFPAAREAALPTGLRGRVFGRPNDMLAVEYLRAAQREHALMAPLAVARRGALHDEAFPREQFASATALRGLLREQGIDGVAAFVPPEAAAVYRSAVRDGLMPFRNDAFEKQMLSYLRRLKESDYIALPDVSEGLENRIAAAVRMGRNMEEVLRAVKTKRYAMSRIRRILLCAFLGLKGELLQKRPPYLRVLGFNGRGAQILRKMKETASLPVVTRYSDFLRLDGFAGEVFELESRATDLYSLCLPSPRPCGTEKSLGIIRDND